MGDSVLDEEKRAKVLRQVEFYFSDSNLPGDKFLLKCIEESEDGLVSLPLVCSFSRMRSHLGLQESGPENVPSETTAAVAEVLRQSATLRLSEDGIKVGRMAKVKTAGEVEAEINARSIAASPLPYKIGLDEVEAFFNKHGKVNSVRLPRLAGFKVFSGYAIVELESEEEAQRFMGLKLAFHDVDLELEPKKAFDEHQEANAQNRQEADSHKNAHHKNGPTNGHNKPNKSRAQEDECDSYPRGVLVSFTLKKNSKPGEGDSSQSSEKDVKTPVEDGKSEAETQMEVQVLREDIKTCMGKFGKINFVEFSRGETTGYVRFDQPDAAQNARAHAVLAPEGGFIVKGHLALLDPVEGEAEKEYWKNLKEIQSKRRDNGGYKDRGRERFGRDRGGGGRGRGRGRFSNRNEVSGSNNGSRKGKHMRFDDEDSQPNKVQRTD